MNRRLMCALLVGLAGLWLGSWPAVSARPVDDVLDRRAMDVAERDGRAPVIVRLAEQADVSAAWAMRGKTERTRFVYERLESVADRTQPPVVEWLAGRGIGARRFLIVNALAVEADAATLVALSSRPDVHRIELEGEQRLIDPEPGVRDAISTGRLVPFAPTVPQVLERGHRTIKVDRVWRKGYKGAGVVVAVVDTGVTARHPALRASYRGWEDGSDYNWFDAIGAEEEPLDGSDHGTHVAGIVVGEQGGRQIGAAPDAQWIACRNIEGRRGPDSASLACLEWVLAPTRLDGTEPRPDLAPDVVNASWGGTPNDGCDSDLLAPAIHNLTAAGILFVTSAGNAGDKCSTVCAPATYPEALAVANYNVSNRQIFGTSSRGPVDTGDGERIKPDVAAPGTDINSSVGAATYAEKTGTSMAAPHVTGAAALILSARPELRGQPEALFQLITSNTLGMNPDRCGPAGDREHNNAAGHGLIDVEDAVDAALVATLVPTPTATPTPIESSTPTPSPTASVTPTEPSRPNATATPRAPAGGCERDGDCRLFLPSARRE